MSSTIVNEISDVLNDIEKYWTNENLAKQIIIEDLRNNDTKLISKLLSSEIINEIYVQDIDGYKIFDKEAFISMLRYKNYWMDSYTKYANKIGLTADGKYLNYNSDVVIDFPFKDCILEGGMTKEDSILKNNEKFYNQVIAKDEVDTLLAAKVFNNIKKFDKYDEHLVKDISNRDNIVIKGNNLIALSSLQKRFNQRIQTIYIDPPFNTDKDSFKYNDKFNESTWLTFMKNRLNIAKELLTESGNIFIHIDNNEVHVLKVLCDEIFGKDNFVEEYIWSYGSASGGRAAGSKPVNIHDYILHYSKKYEKRKQIKQFTPYSEKYINDWFKYKDEDGRLYQRRHRGKNKSGENVWEKQYLDESKGVPLTSVWTDINQVYANPQAYKKGNKSTSEIELEFGNSGQKPEKLIQRILNMSTEEGDIVLDFFMGSGTTAATALKMKRQFITIEQLQGQVNIAQNRLLDTLKGKKSGVSKDEDWQGGGSFIYAELAKENQEIVESIINCDNKEELNHQINKLLNNGVLNYEVDFDKFINTKKEFNELEIECQKEVLIRILDNNQLYVNYSDMEDSAYSFTKDEIAFNHSFYGGE
ncbi:DNA methyltransferase [Staphylococcus cohnii]|uniref:DNA methyltransferase n=2 Tax=Staphylococcus cohnii TaxID=29382 RepID=UPI0011A284F7|nr:site-specific DNA-methyltransferase [Staphylococcus cohnii]